MTFDPREYRRGGKILPSTIAPSTSNPDAEGDYIKFAMLTAEYVTKRNSDNPAQDAAGSQGELTYLEASLDVENRQIHRHDKAADFSRSDTQWKMMAALFRAGYQGLSKANLMERIYSEPRTDNALDQLKLKANEQLIKIELEVSANHAGIWTLTALSSS